MDLNGIMFKYKLYIAFVQLKYIANIATPGLLFLKLNSNAGAANS